MKKNYSKPSLQFTALENCNVILTSTFNANDVDAKQQFNPDWLN